MQQGPNVEAELGALIRTGTETGFGANRALLRSAQAWTAVEPTTGVVNTRIAAVRAGRLMST
jgi:hypothetical protein